jgi:hypothetical protein
MPNWLDPDTYQHILFQGVCRPGERSVGKYFDHSLPSGERLEVMVREACVLAVLIQPRLIKILTLNSSGHDPLGHATKPYWLNTLP